MVGVADDGHGSIWKARCSRLGSSDQVIKTQKAYGLQQAQLFSLRTKQFILYCALQLLTLKLVHEKNVHATAQVYCRQKKWLQLSVFLVSESLITRSFFLSDRRVMALVSTQQKKNRNERKEKCHKTCCHIKMWASFDIVVRGPQ